MLMIFISIFEEAFRKAAQDTSSTIYRRDFNYNCIVIRSTDFSKFIQMLSFALVFVEEKENQNPQTNILKTSSLKSKLRDNKDQEKMKKRKLDSISIENESVQDSLDSPAYLLDNEKSKIDFTHHKTDHIIE